MTGFLFDRFRLLGAFYENAVRLLLTLLFVSKMAAKNLPKVFFDVAVNGQPSGRMTFKVK